MTTIYKENKNIYWQLLSIYIVSRIIISFLGIEPIAEHLSHRWQLMNSKLLEEDLFGVKAKYCGAQTNYVGVKTKYCGVKTNYFGVKTNY